jgi:hypothetical protein
MSNNTLGKDNIIWLGLFLGAFVVGAIKAISPTPPISMEGNWYGTYNTNNTPSTLIVNRQSNDQFEGILTTRGNTGGTFKLVIEGSINSETRKVTMTEVDIISKPLENPWYLGKNEGTLSSDFRSMPGTGQDNRGNGYNWYFSKQ